MILDLYVCGEWTSVEGVGTDFSSRLLEGINYAKTEFSTPRIVKSRRLVERLIESISDLSNSIRSKWVECLLESEGVEKKNIESQLDQFCHVLKNLINLESSLEYEAEYQNSSRSHFGKSQSKPLGVVVVSFEVENLVNCLNTILLSILAGNINIVIGSEKNHQFLEILAHTFSSLTPLPEDPEMKSVFPNFILDTNDIVCSSKKLGSISKCIVGRGSSHCFQKLSASTPASSRRICLDSRENIFVLSSEYFIAQSVQNVSSKISNFIFSANDEFSSTKLVFVESEALGAEVFESISNSVFKLEKEKSYAPMRIEDSCKIQTERNIYNVAESLGVGRVKYAEKNLTWTIVLDHSGKIKTLDCKRYIKIIPYSSNIDLVEKLSIIEKQIGVVALASVKELETNLEVILTTNSDSIVEIANFEGIFTESFSNIETLKKNLSGKAVIWKVESANSMSKISTVGLVGKKESEKEANTRKMETESERREFIDSNYDHQTQLDKQSELEGTSNPIFELFANTEKSDKLMNKERTQEAILTESENVSGLSATVADGIIPDDGEASMKNSAEQNPQEIAELGQAKPLQSDLNKILGKAGKILGPSQAGEQETGQERSVNIKELDSKAGILAQLSQLNLNSNSDQSQQDKESEESAIESKSSGKKVIPYSSRHLTLGGAIIDFSEFESALSGFDISGIQIEFEESIEPPAMKIRLESEEMDSKTLANVQRCLLKKLPELRQCLKSGVLGDLVIELYEKGQLARDQDTGEIPPILCL